MTGRFILCAILASFSAGTMAAEPLCQEKERAIQHEIDLAKQQQNARRVNGLERALTEARAGCTDKKLKSLHQSRIKQHEAEIAERERDLQEARADGDHDKIAKREKKLAEAREELNHAKAAPY